MSKFAEKVKTHLSEYKRHSLDIHVDGIWKSNGEPYGHILPASQEMQNFLPSIKESLSDFVQQNRIKLHTNFLHLNSSQAMCLNFFYPLIITKRLEMILPFLSDQFIDEKIDYYSTCFEKDGQERVWLSESKGRITDDTPTSFDFYFQTLCGKKFFFEVKYTESTFGKEKDDDEHKEKFNMVYEKHLSHIKGKYRTLDSFLQHYQMMRNLTHIDDKSFVVFIYPSQNKEIVKEINIARDVLENYTEHFFPIEWEKLVQYVASRFSEERFAHFIVEFKEKYFFVP